MIVGKIHGIFSFKQSKWLENYVYFDIQRRTLAANGFEKDFYKSLKTTFSGEAMVRVRNTIKIEFIRRDNNAEIVKKQ